MKKKKEKEKKEIIAREMPLAPPALQVHVRVFPAARRRMFADVAHQGLDEVVKFLALARSEA